MSITCPVCQKSKGRTFRMCKECNGIYGDNQEDWPLYVVFLVADDNRMEWQEEQVQAHEVTFADFAPDIQDAIDEGYLVGVKVA